MKIHYNKDFDCYMVAECHKTNVIELDGVKLIPIEELEKIKAELIGCFSQEDDIDSDPYNHALDIAIDIVYNHISELKGENKLTCERNICLQNEYNNIGCEDCVVTKGENK